jgi:hypothetical protein
MARQPIASTLWVGVPIETEPEVTEWLLSLDDEQFGQVERYIDLLADEGVHLAEPFTRQLRGKLRELRFHRGRSQTRITYYIATGRRIILLTVFAKTRPRDATRSTWPGKPCSAASTRDT